MNDATKSVPEEQEVFRRVWQRVMAGREAQASPLQLSAPPSGPVDGDLSCDYLAALSRTQARGGAPADRPGSDLSGVSEAAPGGETTARLRQQTLEALEAWQFYRHLARRTRGNAARILTGLAADQHQLARKLSASYFLHSGVRYWPSEQLAAPAIPSYWGSLRQRHQAEQQAELSFRLAAAETEDPALTELYTTLTEACRSHCRQLRALLEQSCP